MHQKTPTLPSAIISAIQKANRRYDNPHVDQWHATVASYNVHKCVGIDGKFDPERIATVINELDADIIALQEADERFGRKAGLLDLRGLENTAKLVPVFQSGHAYSHGWHGNMILAREGLVSHVRSLKLPGVEPRGALVADLEIKGAKLRIIAAHLGLLRSSRAKQAEALLDATRADEGPTILMGDLNEWRVARRSSLSTLLPHFGPLDVALPSFPSRMPFLALDRILASPQQIISSIEVHDSALARKASDHLPIKARIDLTLPDRAI